MILLNDSITFDFRILAIIGIYITLLLKPLQNKLIEIIQKTIIEELERSNKKNYSKAQKIISKDKTPAREKHYIKRRLNSCTSKYNASDWIRSISGISTICLAFCVFLLFAVFIYSIKEYSIIISGILLSSLCVLILIAVLVGLVHYSGINPNFVYSFNFLSLLYGVIAIIFGIIMAFTHFYLSFLPEGTATNLFYASFGIPFIPILIAFISTTKLYLSKQKSYYLLKKSIKDHHSGKLKQKLEKQ